MRNRITFAIVGLLLSTLPVSAQQTRQRSQPASNRPAVVVPMGRATLPVVRMDRSWRTVGRPNMGGGHYGGYRGGRSLMVGLGVGFGVGLADSLIMRQQMNAAVAMAQPTYDYQPSVQQTIPMVYQPPPPSSQTCNGKGELVENTSADRMYVVIADGEGHQVWNSWVFNHQKVCAPYVERGWTITGSYDARKVQDEHTVGTTTDCRINLNPIPGFGWRSASRCDSSQVKKEN